MVFILGVIVFTFVVSVLTTLISVVHHLVIISLSHLVCSLVLAELCLMRLLIHFS
jgi:hypothetical protein